jgi:CHAT domain-containing protein
MTNMESAFTRRRKLQTTSGRPQPRSMIAWSAILFTVLLPALTWVAFRSNRSRIARIPLLVSRAPREYRVTTGRLSGFAFAPPRRVTRGSDSSDLSMLRLGGAAAEVLLQTAGDVSASARHAAGVARLLTGRHSQALVDLRAAADAASDDAAIQSDLSAAYLASSEEIPSSLPLGLAAVDAALHIDPRYAEARFNRALILERLHLRAAARDAWRSYLQSDSSSPWATEARERLRQNERSRKTSDWKEQVQRFERADPGPEIVRKLVAEYPQQSRGVAEGDYLTRWGVATLAGDQESAARAVLLARSIGSAIHQASGDSLLAEAVAAVDGARNGTLTTLAQALATYRTARQTYAKRMVSASVPLFEESEKLFAQSRSPMAFVARYYRANALFDSGKPKDALVLLDALRRDVPDRFRSLRAQISWERGIVLAAAGMYFQSLDETFDAMASFDALGEVQNSTSMRLSAAAILSVLGRHAEIWPLQLRAFDVISDLGNDGLLEAAINAAARNELMEHRLAAAASLLDLELALPPAAPRLRADALLWRLVAEEHDKRQIDFGPIKDAALQISDGALREQALDDIRLQEGARARTMDPPLALRLITQSVEFRTAHGLTSRLPVALIERSRTYRALGRYPECEADLLAAIEGVEHQTAAIMRADLRDAFLDRSTEAFLDLFDLKVGLGQIPAAFDVIERWRAQVVSFDTAPNGRARALTLPEIQKSLPEGTVVVHLVALSDRLVILMTGRGELVADSVSMSRQVLEQNARLGQAIERHDEAATRRHAEWLHSAIVRPVARAMKAYGRIVFVPDETMAGVPFAMLRDPSTGRYLIEDTEVIVAPSANAFVKSAKNARPACAGGCTASVIADPAFDQRQFPTLERLPAAAAEIRGIAAMYQSSVTAVGQEATRRAFLDALHSSDVLQFAGHALPNDYDPALSVLPLAPDGADDGLLYLREVVSLRLARAPIVVLAGCGTASPSSGHGAVRSLSLAFLAAGSRSVIGTLWKIDDDAAHALALEFHRQLRSGFSASAALRSAQLAMLHSVDRRLRDPRTWAAFQLFGSGA